MTNNNGGIVDSNFNKPTTLQVTVGTYDPYPDVVKGYSSSDHYGSISKSYMIINDTMFDIDNIIINNVPTSASNGGSYLRTFHIKSEQFNRNNGFNANGRGVLKNYIMQISVENKHPEPFHLYFDDCEFDYLDNRLVWNGIPSWLADVHDGDKIDILIRPKHRISGRSRRSVRTRRPNVEDGEFIIKVGGADQPSGEPIVRGYHRGEFGSIVRNFGDETEVDGSITLDDEQFRFDGVICQTEEDGNVKIKVQSHDLCRGNIGKFQSLKLEFFEPDPTANYVTFDFADTIYIIEDHVFEWTGHVPEWLINYPIDGKLGVAIY